MKKTTIVCISILICIAGNSQLKLKGGKDVPTSPCTTPMGSIMFAPVDTTGRRGAADNYKIWNNGTVLKVKFLNGSQDMRQKVMNFQKEWEQYANIKFNYVSDSDPVTDIRIRFGSKYDKLGHNSAVGLDCQNPRYNAIQTMNLDTSDFFDYDYYIAEIKSRGPFYQHIIGRGRNLNSYNYQQLFEDVISYPMPKVYVEKRIRRKSQHEMGHALGLLHEQSYPGAIKWNKDTIYKYYAEIGWDKETVDFNVLEVADRFYTNGTDYDPLSIMHYPVYAWQTLDGFSVDESTTISQGDKKLVAALYPKDKKISDLDVPKVIISNNNKLDIKADAKRKAFVILPSFDVKTGSLTASAYYLARLLTEDGKYYIPTDKSFYSWNGMAATYLRMNLLPNSSISYNKTPTSKLEMLFPYNQIPSELMGKKFKVEFSVYQNNAATGKMDKIVMYATSTSMSMSR